MNYNLILIITFSPHIILSLINQTKNAFRFGYNETYWESLSPFTPINNASYGTIKLGRSLKMEFKFIYIGRARNWTNNTRYHENAFRVGYSSSISNRGDGAGSRYPSMWIYYIDGIPHCKFSISHTANTWKEFTNLFELEPQEIYSVFIEFNQTNIFISITDTTQTYIVTDGERMRSGTDAQYLDTFMHIWISQFGHNQNKTAAANITMFDVAIQTWDHAVLPPSTVSPTTSAPTARTKPPTIIPITIAPTQAPTARTKSPTITPITIAPTQTPIAIGSVVSSEPIELYEFYDEYNVIKYKQNTDLYAGFIYDAIILALENVTEHSMDIRNGDAYYDRTWVFGGVHDFVHCMVFSDKRMGMHMDCPLIPQPHSNQFEYAAVGLLYVESDANVTDFRDYIVEQLSSITFAEMFRSLLSQIVNEDQTLAILHKKQDGSTSDALQSMEIIGFIVILLGLSMCGVWKICYDRRLNEQQARMEMVSVCNEDTCEQSETSTNFPIERT